jgi:hypothetical protein
VIDFEDIRQKVMAWTPATGGLILSGLVFVILFPIILKFMFDFGNSGGAARWPFLKDIVLFTPWGLFRFSFISGGNVVEATIDRKWLQVYLTEPFTDGSTNGSVKSIDND